ncbi:MAG: arsenate reductase/protein-tyrosine-phosphatase family protein [Phycisphaerales bacterium]
MDSGRGIEVVRSAEVGPGGVRAATERAARLLAEGRLVVLPTETLYGVFAAETDEGRSRLAGLMGTETAGGAAWHTGSVQAALDMLGVDEPVHAWLMRRLLPGPVTVARGPSGPAVRVVDEPIAARTLALVEERGGRALACAAAGRSAAGDLGDGADIGRLAARGVVFDALDAAGVGLMIDAGRTRHAKVSTLVRLEPGGGHTVVREGAVPARAIERRLVRSVLFVCTGNTCRSPMAEALARSQLADEPWGSRVRVGSAGVSAASGSAMTREARTALRGAGVEPAAHRSRPLTESLVRESDEIYAMTVSHLAAIEAAFPSARGRVFLLDPDGADVPDPIGGAQSVYDSTCAVLRELVRRRLASGTPGQMAGRSR